MPKGTFYSIFHRFLAYFESILGPDGVNRRRRKRVEIWLNFWIEFLHFFADFGSPGPSQNHTFSPPGASGKPPGSLRSPLAEPGVIFSRFFVIFDRFLIIFLSIFGCVLSNQGRFSIGLCCICLLFCGRFPINVLRVFACTRLVFRNSCGQRHKPVLVLVASGRRGEGRAVLILSLHRYIVLGVWAAPPWL